MPHTMPGNVEGMSASANPKEWLCALIPKTTSVACLSCARHATPPLRLSSSTPLPLPCLHRSSHLAPPLCPLPTPSALPPCPLCLLPQSPPETVPPERATVPPTSGGNGHQVTPPPPCPRGDHGIVTEGKRFFSSSAPWTSGVSDSPRGRGGEGAVPGGGMVRKVPNPRRIQFYSPPPPSHSSARRVSSGRRSAITEGAPRSPARARAPLSSSLVS